MENSIENLNAFLNTLKDENKNLNDFVSMLRNENTALKEENTSVKSENSSLKAEVENLKKENEQMKEDNLLVTKRKKFGQKRMKVREIIMRGLNNAKGVKASEKVKLKLFNLLVELLEKEKIPFSEIKKRYWRSSKTISYNLRYLKALGYVQVGSENKKGILILSPGAKGLKASIEKIINED